MAIRTLHKRLVAPVGAFLLVAAACSNPAGPSSGLAVSGSWQGSALLPNGYNATLTLQQNGTSVTGTMRIGGVMGESPISGTVASGNRTFTWLVNYDCEIWSGVLTVASNNREMDGPLSINRTGCVPAQSSGSGTLTLDKQ
jgi:hypothetical protein